MTLEGFRLLPTTASLVFSGVVIVMTGALCFAAWHRSGYTMKIGLLEGLRFLVVAVVLFTLNQPEWVFQEKPREQPVVAVLWDDSGSMRTRDVTEANDPSAPPITRAEWAARMTKPERLRSRKCEGIETIEFTVRLPHFDHVDIV